MLCVCSACSIGNVKLFDYVCEVDNFPNVSKIVSCWDFFHYMDKVNFNEVKLAFNHQSKEQDLFHLSSRKVQIRY